MLSCLLGEIYSPEETVQQSTGELSCSHVIGHNYEHLLGDL